MSAHLKVSSTWRQISNIRLKVSNTWRSVAQAYLKVGSTWRLFFSSSALIPTQTSAPDTPGGTGEAFTSVTRGASGSYTSYSSKTHSLVKVLETYTITSPSTVDTNDTSLSSTYTVTQNDATTPQYNFYTRDNVVGLNGTTYYFYSAPLSAYVGDVTDNFNRTTSGGLGNSSSGYIYSSYGNLTGSWSTNGSYAINSSAVSSGDSASNHPLQTIEVGNPNKNYSIDLPDGKGGKGVAFWTTSANSWYAVASYYDYDSSTATQPQCNSTSSCTGLNCCSSVTFGNQLGQRCVSSCPAATITYPCGQNGVTYTCSGYNCCSNNLGSLAGDYCNCTNTNTSSTTQVLTCSGSSSSSSCPGTGSTVGARCGSCSSTTTCTGSGSNSYCPDIGSNVGDRCGSCSSSSTNTLTGYSYTVRTMASSTTYTYGACRSISAGEPFCPSCSGTTSKAQYNCSTGFWQCRCEVTTTTYPCSGGTVTTSNCPGTGSLSGDRCSSCTPVYTTTTTYTYPTRQQAYNYSVYAYQDVTTYTSNYQVRGTQYDYTYSVMGPATVSAYSYNTKIKLFSAVSGTVASQSWDSPYPEGLIMSNYVIGSFDPTQWIGIYNITASTNGNTVTATAYDSGGGIMGQTVGKTLSNPTKQNANGETAAGIIKTYSSNNVGTSYDNFEIY